MLKQKMMEQLLVENRVRKLKQDEERMQRQIRNAKRNSELADQVLARKEEDQRLKEHMQQKEQ
jgi:hypothetical protein